jgi:hypothetical protein
MSLKEKAQGHLDYVWCINMNLELNLNLQELEEKIVSKEIIKETMVCKIDHGASKYIKPLWKEAANHDELKNIFDRC